MLNVKKKSLVMEDKIYMNIGQSVAESGQKLSLDVAE